MMSNSRLVSIVCAAILAVTVDLVAPLQGSVAAEPWGKAVVVVYGDGPRDWTAEMTRCARLLDPRDRPDIRAGQTGGEVPENAILVWFGDLSHEEGALEGVPEELAGVAAELGRDVADRSAGLAEGEVRVGANCYTRHVDRADGLPRIAVNFSGDDPQGFCRGLTISHVLSGAGRWMRNDGSDCLVRGCEVMRIQR